MRWFVIYRPLALGCSLNLTPSRVFSLGISRARNADVEPFFVAYKEGQLYEAKQYQLDLLVIFKRLMWTVGYISRLSGPKSPAHRPNVSILPETA